MTSAPLIVLLVLTGTILALRWWLGRLDSGQPLVVRPRDLGIEEMALSWHEPARVAQLAVETLSRGLGGSAVYVLELAPGGRELRLRAGLGLPEADVSPRAS